MQLNGKHMPYSPGDLQAVLGVPVGKYSTVSTRNRYTDVYMTENSRTVGTEMVRAEVGEQLAAGRRQLAANNRTTGGRGDAAH
jgi:hypothetical protein